MIKSILGFLKRHAFNLVCAVVAAGSIAAAAMGLNAMSQVSGKLNEVVQLHGQFSGPSRKPVNDRVVQAQKTRVETIQANFKSVMERAHELNQYEPLAPPADAVGNPRFFPEPNRDGALLFKEIYPKQFDALLNRLNAGRPPTAADIEQMQVTIEEEHRQELFRTEGTTRGGGKGGEAPAKPTNKSGLITSEEARESAAARESIRQARQIYCYADLNSFQRNPAINAGLSPRAYDMWQAQLSLWIQQDVVASLARVNEQAAAKLKADGERPWVGVLPVKELISIRTSPYVRSGDSPSPSADRKLEGEDPVDPLGSPATAFTQNASDDMYEVVQFTLKMVVDSRDIPSIIDEICKDKFHTLLDINYVYDRETLESLRMEGKIYGSGPAVIVVMDFETLFFGDIYRRIMPDAVLGELGKERPAEPEGDQT